MNHVVKKAGHEEPFDIKKIFLTSYNACLNASLEDEAAQKIAKKVSQEVDKWVKKKKQVSTGDIFEQVEKALAKEDKNASFMYATHRDIF